jgi:hypothetical protein
MKPFLLLRITGPVTVSHVKRLSGRTPESGVIAHKRAVMVDKEIKYFVVKMLQREKLMKHFVKDLNQQLLITVTLNHA